MIMTNNSRVLRKTPAIYCWRLQSMKVDIDIQTNYQGASRTSFTIHDSIYTTFSQTDDNSSVTPLEVHNVLHIYTSWNPLQNLFGITVISSW